MTTDTQSQLSSRTEIFLRDIFYMQNFCLLNKTGKYLCKKQVCAQTLSQDFPLPCSHICNLYLQPQDDPELPVAACLCLVSH